LALRVLLVQIISGVFSGSEADTEVVRGDSIKVVLAQPESITRKRTIAVEIINFIKSVLA